MLTDKVLEQTEIVQKMEIELSKLKEIYRNSLTAREIAINKEADALNNVTRFTKELNDEKLKLSEFMVKESK